MLSWVRSHYGTYRNRILFHHHHGRNTCRQKESPEAEGLGARGPVLPEAIGILPWIPFHRASCPCEHTTGGSFSIILGTDHLDCPYRHLSTFYPHPALFDRGSPSRKKTISFEKVNLDRREPDEDKKWKGDDMDNRDGPFQE